MDTFFRTPKRLRIICLVLLVAGIAVIAFGLLNDPARTWPNLLLNNMFFLSISIGALLFYSIQFITGSAWSAIFQRLPLALGAFIPLGGLLMLALFFGLPHIYQWAQPGITETDKLIAHKEPFLNVPFFMIRNLIYFSAFAGLYILLGRLANKEDQDPNPAWYQKSAYWGKVFIFVAVLLFSMAAIDWIMTIDAHWYSTLFGFRAMVTSMYFATAVIILLLYYLKSSGYFPELKMAHRHDLARYLFRFSIVFGYLWFMQFLILWYANIPELTVYYYPRFLGVWQPLFYAEILINFAIPFAVLMADAMGQKKFVLLAISLLLIPGLYISFFLQIMPGSYGEMRFGLIELGSWLAYAAAFILLTLRALGKRSLIPHNHPLLEASKHHHL